MTTEECRRARPGRRRTRRRPAGRASCASTSARRRAWARRTRCSTRRTGGSSAAPTWSSAWSRRTAGPRPRRCSTAWRCCPDGWWSYRGAHVRGDGRRRRARPPARGRAGRRARPHQRARQPARRSAGRTSRSCSTPASSVLTTVNVQHLESLNDVVQTITGVPQRETVPDEVVRAADQVELVDITPEALRRRMAHGNVYAADKVDAALGNYFRVGNLTALRELALLWLAGKVDEQLDRYRSEHGIDSTWETRERVVVALTGGPEGDTLIRRAARIAARNTGADLLAVHVVHADGLTDANPANLSRQRILVENLGGTYHQVVGDDVPRALLDFARAENATQLVLGASRRGRLARILAPGTGVTTTALSGSIDVHMVTHEQIGQRPASPPAAVGRPDPAPATARRSARRGAAAAAHPGAGRPARLAQPDQRRAAVPARDRRRRPGRGRLAGGRRRGRRLAPAQLLLRPAAARVHHRRAEQRLRHRGVRRGRADGQRGGRPGRAAHQPGRPGHRRRPRCSRPRPATSCAASGRCRRCWTASGRPSA